MVRWLLRIVGALLVVGTAGGLAYLGLRGLAGLLGGAPAADSALLPERTGLPEHAFFEEVAMSTGIYDLAPAWGLSWQDIDLDGDEDLFVSLHMHFPSHLYLNENGLFFRRSQSDLGELVGLDDHQGAWGDVDGDSFPDLYTVSGYYRPDRLMRNQQDGSFREVTEEYGLDLGRMGRGRSALWADFTGDGFLDLLVSNLFTPDLYYVRDPSSGFREMAQGSGLGNSFSKEGAVAGDFDRDGDLDVFVPLPRERSLYFVNRGDGTFVERSEENRLDVVGRALAAAVGDYDGDGWLDLYVVRSDRLGDLLLRNDGSGSFADATAEAGIEVVSTGLRNAGFVDFDNDGWLDLYVISGGKLDESNDTNRLYRNLGDGSFAREEFGQSQNVTVPGNTAAASFADFNRDGFQDMAVTNGGGALTISGPIQLFRNRGVGGHWLRLHPNGAQGNTAGAGAWVEARLGSDRLLLRVAGGSRVFGQDESGVHFGLGERRHVDQVSVRWTSGMRRRMQGVPADQSVMLVESAGPGFVNSHPAALLGEVPTFDLPAAVGRAQARMPGPEPEPDDRRARERSEGVIAWAAARELAREIRIEPELLDQRWQEMVRELETPRFWVQQVAMGHFTTFRRPPRLPWPEAKEVARGLRAGSALQELATEVRLRAWGKAGTQDRSLRGYVEEGWHSAEMLEARYGARHARRIARLRRGEVYGPVRLREGRDVQDPDLVWPVLRVFRMVERSAEWTPQRAEHEEDLRRGLWRTQFAAALDKLGAICPSGERRGSSCQLFGGVAYEVSELAAVGRERELDRRSDVRVALDRAAREAELDRRVQELVEGLAVAEREIRERVDIRTASWDRPQRVAGVKLFFRSREEAEAAATALDRGSTVEELQREMRIAALTVRPARAGGSHFERVVYDRALWERVASEVGFEEVVALEPGRPSRVSPTSGGFIVFQMEKVIPPEPMPPPTAWRRAERELLQERSDALVDWILGLGEPLSRGSESL